MPRSEPESWQRNVWALALVVFTAFVGFQFFAPFCRSTSRSWASPTRRGWPSGPACCWPSRPACRPARTALGRLSDRVGRKIMLIRSLAGFVVIIAAMGLVTSVYQLFIARLLQGVFAGFSVMAMAVASVSCPRDKVPVAIGRVQSAQLLSAAVGPFVGGYIASHFGIRATFFVTAALCALALAGLIVLFKEARPSGAGEVARRPPHLSLRDLFRLPHLPLVLGLLLICQFIDRGLALLIPLKVADLAGVERIAEISGVIISVSAVCGTISASVAGRLARQLADRPAAADRLRRGRGPCALMAWATRGSISWSCAPSSDSAGGRGDIGLFAGWPPVAERDPRRRLRLACARRPARHGAQPAGHGRAGRAEPFRRFRLRRRARLDRRGPPVVRGARPGLPGASG